jgi:D-glycero-D-manno-heptose 1,7-bisphosphate phosphatase
LNAASRPAVFLDRDGTIVKEADYLAEPKQVRILPGAADALRRLSRAGYVLIVVTNQSGIARGLYTEADFFRVQRRVEQLLTRAGVHLEGVYFCPHHPDFTGPCDCRKPGLALYQLAIAEHGIDATRSLFVGDRLKDVEPARQLGGRGVLVRTGYGEQEQQRAGPDFLVVQDLAELADHIVEGDARPSKG